LRAAREALRAATDGGGANSEQLSNAKVTLAMALDGAGQSLLAEAQYMEADAIDLRGPAKSHLDALNAAPWANRLLRTGRLESAKRLATQMREQSVQRSWPVNVAYADWLLGRCDLVEGDARSAKQRVSGAFQVLRAGDHLVDWVAIFPDLAEAERLLGDFAEAERLCAEAIAVAGPRSLVPTHGSALVTRARIRGDRFVASGDNGDLARARDDADHAYRMATVVRRLPWLELDAARAHALLDRASGDDRAWSVQEQRLRARLVPPGLDPDPLTTNEAAVAAEAAQPEA